MMLKKRIPMASILLLLLVIGTTSAKEQTAHAKEGQRTSIYSMIFNKCSTALVVGAALGSVGTYMASMYLHGWELPFKLFQKNEDQLSTQVDAIRLPSRSGAIQWSFIERMNALKTSEKVSMGDLGQLGATVLTDKEIQVLLKIVQSKKTVRDQLIGVSDRMMQQAPLEQQQMWNALIRAWADSDELLALKGIIAFYCEMLKSGDIPVSDILSDRFAHGPIEKVLGELNMLKEIQLSDIEVYGLLEGTQCVDFAIDQASKEVLVVLRRVSDSHLTYAPLRTFVRALFSDAQIDILSEVLNNGRKEKD